MKAATARLVSMSGLRAARAAAWVILALGGARRKQGRFLPSKESRRMIMTLRKPITAILGAVLVAAGLAGNILGQMRGDPSASATGNQYLVEFKGTRIPDNLPARMAALGGNVIDVFPEMKVALVANLTDVGAVALAAQSDVADVTLDEFLPPEQPLASSVSRTAQFASVNASASDPTSAFAYPYQWNLRVIEADRAWAKGYLGSPDVRIAILDTGLDPANPDFAGLIDYSRSTSFVPEENDLIAQEFPGYPPWTDLDGHGTWVASIAASNGTIIAGVTSRTTLMAVKRAGIVPFRGSSTFRSIAYAADNGADVINMSFRLNNSDPKAGQKGFFHYYTLFVRYALQKGVSAVVVAAGNDAIDLDHNGNGFQGFCDVPGVFCVSATGPTDFGPAALGPWANTDAAAFYTNFGASAIHVAAPGGNLSFDQSGNLVGFGTLFGACASTDRRFDGQGNIVPGVCSSGGYPFTDNLGTSGSAAHVSGLAALLVSRMGHGNPAQVRSAILNSADDRGKPGVDPFYGRGRINVARALGIR